MKYNKNNINDLGLQFFNTRNEIDFNNLYIEVKQYYEGLLTLYIDKNSDIFDDVISISITKIYKKIHQYNNTFKFTTWIFTILVRTALVELNKRNKVDNTSLDIDINSNNIEYDNTYDEMLKYANTLHGDYKLIAINILKNNMYDYKHMLILKISHPVYIRKKKYVLDKLLKYYNHLNFI